ncbi:MAG TPA: GNAT family N-acetyltransferase [Cyclobacteriaceae bacterium]|nr:GNAT family N-acetyltransferase [Cyclobacteriaceae bacterium]
MLEKCRPEDLHDIYTIINDAASAYKGVIPGDRWHDPYMPPEELTRQVEEGVIFWGYKEGDTTIGVMGLQDRGDVTLIRHAYVRTSHRNKGIGGKLLQYLTTLTSKPVLIGTWADATWAVDFYKKHGFRLITGAEKDRLLKKYWNIPQRQVETSVVLANADWK